MEFDQLSNRVIGCAAIEVHRHLRSLNVTKYKEGIRHFVLRTLRALRVLRGEMAALVKPVAHINGDQRRIGLLAETRGPDFLCQQDMPTLRERMAPWL